MMMMGQGPCLLGVSGETRSTTWALSWEIEHNLGAIARPNSTYLSIKVNPFSNPGLNQIRCTERPQGKDTTAIKPRTCTRFTECLFLFQTVCLFLLNMLCLHQCDYKCCCHCWASQWKSHCPTQVPPYWAAIKLFRKHFLQHLGTRWCSSFGCHMMWVRVFSLMAL